MALNTRKLSKDECDRRGWSWADADCWNPYSKRWRDLFGFIDLVALTGKITAIQFTSRTHVSERKQKLLEIEDARRWLEGGGRILVWGWRKVREGRRMIPDLREVEVTLADFDG